MSVSLGVSQWVFDRLDASEKGQPAPLLSVQWVPVAKDTQRCNDAVDSIRVLFSGVQYNCSDLVEHTYTMGLWTDIALAILSEEIQQRDIPNTPVSLTYIDFFAGSDLGSMRYAAFRWLKQEGLLDLTPRMVKDEIEYLYPDVPLNIQSKTGERLLHTQKAVADWKTEVLQQEYYSERLEQELMKLLEGEEEYQNNPLKNNGGFIFTMDSGAPDYGWVSIRFTVKIPNCPTISDVQSVYTTPDKLALFTLPLWAWSGHPDCLNVLNEMNLDAIEHMSMEFRSESNWNDSIIWVLDRERKGCSVIKEKMNASCFGHR